MSVVVDTKTGSIVYTYSKKEAGELHFKEFLVSWDTYDDGTIDDDNSCIVYAKNKEEINYLIDYWNELEHISVYNKIP